MAAVSADAVLLPRLLPWPGSRPRVVKSVTEAPSGFEGEGFPVRRAFAGVSKADVDPFVHMDQMGEVEYAPGEPKGTPWHPHRGFETFTYLIDGEFVHQDSLGGGGVISPGGTQYMTAGDGILHIETPPERLVMSGGLFHGVQLWINLPRALKRTAPQYQDLQGQDLVLLASADAGALVRVLAGELAGHRGPGISHTPLVIAHATVQPGARLEVPWRRDFNALVYVLAGSGSVGLSGHPFGEGQLAVLVDGDSVVVEADSVQSSRSPALELLLLGGVPLREPVVQYGPFVMSSPEEVRQALDDFQAGRFGQVPPGAVQPFRAR